jgi:hypothetical protein
MTTRILGRSARSALGRAVQFPLGSQRFPRENGKMQGSEPPIGASPTSLHNRPRRPARSGRRWSFCAPPRLRMTLADTAKAQRDAAAHEAARATASGHPAPHRSEVVHVRAGGSEGVRLAPALRTPLAQYTTSGLSTRARSAACARGLTIGTLYRVARKSPIAPVGNVGRVATRVTRWPAFLPASVAWHPRSRGKKPAATRHTSCWLC